MSGLVQPVPGSLPAVHARVLVGGVVHTPRYLDTTPRNWPCNRAITTSYESGSGHLVQTSTRLVQTTTLSKRKKYLCTSCTMVRERTASVRGSGVDSVAIARRRGGAFSGRLVHAFEGAPMNEKHCPGCDQTKPVSEFYRETGCQTYRRLCKRCFNRDLRTRYTRKYETGWSIEQYEAQRIVQGGRCAVCGEHESSLPIALAADHNHLTLTRRGLLCARCNRGIGVFEDSPELLRQAADYLDRHAQAHPQVVDA